MSFIASLPMYDWPERRAEVDAEWAAIRDRLRADGIEAPQELSRDIEEGTALWKRPDLLFSQTCWGPMELGLAEHVQVVGQPSYDSIEGGQGEFYSSAIVMRTEEDRSEIFVNRLQPPSVLSDISPSRGEIGSFGVGAHSATLTIGDISTAGPISPLEGEMSDRTEGGRGRASIPLNLLCNARFAYNSPESMSGIIGLTRDLEALGESLDIFSSRIETGGHRNSIRTVAEGRADVAAIDCMSWHLARLYEPAAQQVQVVGWTAKRKGLPFITAKRTSADVVAILRQTLRAF